MAHIDIRDSDVELDDATLVEGLPGLGLVGKIATDHLIEEFEMNYFASVHCDGLPSISVYQPDDRLVRPPVRLYVDELRDLVALQSDVPISSGASAEFAECVVGWLEAKDVTPLFLSGYPSETKEPPLDLFGVATSPAAGERLDDHEIDLPDENGAIAGPTGALLDRAAEAELDGVGLVVESDPRFPDPEAARALIDRGIGPLADLEVDVSGLVDQAETIRDQKEQLAQQMRQADAEESSQAQPIRMFQ